jgi:hypothetical protein
MVRYIKENLPFKGLKGLNLAVWAGNDGFPYIIGPFLWFVH